MNIFAFNLFNGTDAIVCVRFTTSVIVGGAAELLSYGTAVKLQDADQSIAGTVGVVAASAAANSENIASKGAFGQHDVKDDVDTVFDHIIRTAAEV